MDLLAQCDHWILSKVPRLDPDRVLRTERRDQSGRGGGAEFWARRTFWMQKVNMAPGAEAGGSSEGLWGAEGGPSGEVATSKDANKSSGFSQMPGRQTKAGRTPRGRGKGRPSSLVNTPLQSSPHPPPAQQ